MPGSAVLVFDIELLELVAGLPEGYMFIWNGEVSPNLFEEIDKDGNGEVLLEEVNGPCRSCSGAFSGAGVHSVCPGQDWLCRSLVMVGTSTCMYQGLLHTSPRTGTELLRDGGMSQTHRSGFSSQSLGAHCRSAWTHVLQLHPHNRHVKGMLMF